MAEHLTIKTAAGTLLSAVLAGAMISIGGTVNLSLDNRVLGACFFSIGLFFVVSMLLGCVPARSAGCASAAGAMRSSWC